MSFYTDSTIADLPVILELVSLSADPKAMGIRFASQTSDPDLAQVLQDLGADAGTDPLFGWMQFGRDFRTLLGAVQGIEDATGLDLSVQADQTSGRVIIEVGGTAIEFP